MSESVRLKAISVSPGIAIGDACVLDDILSRPRLYHLSDDQLEGEVVRLNAAIADAISELEDIRETASSRLGDSHLYILDVGILLLEDEKLIGEARNRIRSQKTNAEWAVQAAIDHFTKTFEGMDDPYLRDRKLDIAHAGERILRHLARKVGSRESLLSQGEPAIIVAHDLTPADVAALSTENMKGLITVRGGPTSHTAILAKALGIPAVVGAETATQRISTGDQVVLDAHLGEVIVNPASDVLSRYEKQLRAHPQPSILEEPEISGPVVTLDGVRIFVSANIEYDRELDTLSSKGVDGVGLYRSEHLYFNRSTAPSEEEYYAQYRRLAESAYPNPAVIRTMDMGGDRPPPPFAGLIPEESNPALGLRAIRFSLCHRDLFKIQLRGILRAAVHGNLKIMYPMISGIDELREIKSILNEAKDELKKEGQLFAEPEEGVLIETPAAVMCAEMIGRHVNFLGVGSNDLTQYTLAVDRTNKEVADLFEPFHPGMLRMYRQMVQAASSAGISITVCGELASEPESALILIGLGFRSLSMTMSRISEVKAAIRKATLKELTAFSMNLMDCETSGEVRELMGSVRESYRKNPDRLRSSA